MNFTDPMIITESSAPENGPAQTPSWAGALWAATIFPFAPRRAALRAARASLFQALVLHWLGLLMVLTTAIGVTAYHRSLVFPGTGLVRRKPFIQAFRLILADFCSALESGKAKLAAVVVILVVEVGLGLGALLLLSWATNPEPLYEARQRTLKCLWLNTVHLAWLVLGIGSLVNLLTRLRYDFYWQHMDAQSQQVDLALVYSQRMMWWSHEEYVMGGAFALGFLWLFFSYLRATATPTATACPLQPPTCEFCGYNLSHATLDGQCSECGAEVQSSLGPEVRRIFEWESLQRPSFPLAFIRYTATCLISPGKLLARVPSLSGQPRARLFLVLSIATAAALSAGSAPLLFWVDDGTWPDKEVWAALPIVAIFLFLAIGVACVGLGSLAGLLASRFEGRNLLPAMNKVVCYSSGLWAAWCIGGTFVAATTIYYEAQLDELSVYWFNASDALLVAINLLFHGAFLVFYIDVLRRGLSRIRYANR